MAGLLDFLQSASNAAASNVTGPVDGIAWLLRKAGLDVGEPVGGSDWAKRKGLMRDVPQSAASLAGETAGLLGPIAAAAKAPQIARGLLQAGENLAAPRTMNPELGAIVWHGSPHKFDKFDASKIGTGEGAQAYGHGLYLADETAVARSYMAPERAYARNGRMTPFEERISDYMDKGLDPVQMFSRLTEAGYKVPKGNAQTPYDNLLETYSKLRAMDKEGSLYKVDLPDDKIARMLDWDKPLSQQAPEVQRAAMQLPDIAKAKAKEDLKSALTEYQTARKQWAAMSKDDRELASLVGADNRVTALQKAKSARDSARAVPAVDESMTGQRLHDLFHARYMQPAGIPGIRYLDGGSRGAGAGTSNYVVFPGEENILTILERNGIPIR